MVSIQWSDGVLYPLVALFTDPRPTRNKQIYPFTGVFFHSGMDQAIEVREGWLEWRFDQYSLELLYK